METHLETIAQAKRTIIDLCIKFGPKVIAALMVLIIGFFAARWVGLIVQRWFAKFQLDPPVRLLFIRVARALTFAVFALMALQNLGVEVLPLIAGFSVIGAGVALAMQGVLGNLVAGLSIIFSKPFRVGEYIAIVGVEGRVESVDLFTTVLSHPDRSRVVIPNRKIVGEILHNYGQIRQLDVLVGVAYQTDLTLALATVQELLRGNARVLADPVAVVGISTLADSSIQIAVKPWVKVPDFVPAAGEINKAIVEEFRTRGISVPFPQREIRLLQ